jgi:SAM-dependent methyltransferase
MSNAQAETYKDANRMAVSANLAMYDYKGTANSQEGAPHLMHLRLRELYAQLVLRVFNAAKEHAPTPRILDLGAGDGSATLPFLGLGAHVTAVDVSEKQLAALRERCSRFGDRLRICHEEISKTLRRQEDRYDVVVMNSFLHHIPDYLTVVREAIALLRPRGQFFSFQDPLRYDTLGPGTWFLSKAGYFSWRLFQGNYMRGLKTRIRRLRGVYISGKEEDDAEYHANRNGVDQDAIANLLRSEGFSCEVIGYFSAQSRAFQVLGTSLGTKNTFAIIAQKQKASASDCLKLTTSA